MQLDSDIDTSPHNVGHAKQQINQQNESFGLDLSNLNNITSVQDQSLHDINNRLQVLRDEDQYNYKSELSHQKIEAVRTPNKAVKTTGGGIIKETRNELQNQIKKLAETMRRQQ